MRIPSISLTTPRYTAAQSLMLTGHVQKNLHMLQLQNIIILKRYWFEPGFVGFSVENLGDGSIAGPNTGPSRTGRMAHTLFGMIQSETAIKSQMCKKNLTTRNDTTTKINALLV